jgi:exodeoxyribonuclease VII small subunit
MTKTPTPPSPEIAATPVAAFERSLGELESIVARLEGGELGLDESLAAFERGIALYRECQSALDAAEQRVRLLVDPADPDASTPFAPAAD